MIGAIVINDMVENVIVLDEAQIEEMEAALNCRIVDARPYGLTIGDLYTNAGWTRNAGGEQILLPKLDQEQYDSYTLATQKAAKAEAQAKAALEAEAQARAEADAAIEAEAKARAEVDTAAEEAVNEALAILSGEVKA